MANPAEATAIARTVVGLVEPLGPSDGTDKGDGTDDGRNRGHADEPRGRVFVGQRDVTHEPPGRRRQIGYVPVEGGLLPHLVVQRNLGYGLPRQRRRSRLWFRREPEDRQATERMDGLTRALELGPTLHLRPDALLASQRFHAAAARAVACLHEVLVVDLPHAVPGAMALDEILRRVRAAVPATETMAVLVCSDDDQVLQSVDRRVHGTPRPDGPDSAAHVEGAPGEAVT